jgi:hypothetical protein
MWIGLLTAGAHPSRPAAVEHLATLFAWGPQTRARVDGPQGGIPDGIRALRRSARDDIGTLCRPRCFSCRRPYPLPDAGEIRAQQDIVDLADGLDADDPDVAGPDDEGAGPRPARAPRTKAVFALVHVEDHAPEGDEGEALVLVPSTMLALLAPFDAVGLFADLIGKAFGDVPLPGCDGCGEPVPGGTLGAPNRAARRRAARGRSGRDSGEGRRAA